MLSIKFMNDLINDWHNVEQKVFRMNPTVRLEKIVIFQCRICNYADKCPKSYMDHYMTHIFQSRVVLSRTIYECDKCSKVFVDKGDLKIHKLIHVRNDVSKKLKKIHDERKYPNSGKYVKRFSCGECSMKFVLESTLMFHAAVHEPFPYLCSCGIGYYKLNDLIAHERLVHPKKIEVKTKEVSTVIYKDDDFSDGVTCDNDSGDELKRKKKKRKTPRIKIRPKAVTGKRRIQCKYCSGNVRFESRRDLNKHLESHTELPYACKICCLKFPTQDLLLEHDTRHTFPCTICDKVFKYRNNLEIHMRSHTKERPYKCDICNKSFTQSGSLGIHVKIHMGIKDFQCRYCNKDFISKSARQLHEHTHTGAKPHVCSYCNKPFADPSALKRHIRTHTKEYRYKCDLCEKQFTDISGLRTHKLSRHGKRTFECEVCNKKFYTRYDLKNHVSVHSDTKRYECNECGNKFSRKQYLLLHLERSHNAVRQECPDCGKKCKDDKELKKHVIDRHSLVLYCSTCPKSFRLESSFKAHKRKGCANKNSQKG